MHSKLVLLLSGISVIPFIFGSPVKHLHMLPRQTVNCTNPQAPYDEYCWEALNVEGWLTNTTSGWTQRTPTCQGNGPGQDGSACCLPSEPWSTCFLRLEQGKAGYDCTVFNTGFCSFDPQSAVAAGIEPEARYVLRNIYAINNFFTTWFTALQYATSQAQLTLQPIVNELDQPQPQNYELTYMLTALTVGLALIPGIGEAELGIDAATVTVGTALLTALQNAPGVAKVIWPSGTINSQNVQIAQLDNYVGQLNAQLSNNLGAGLDLIMNNMAPFIGFAKGGVFSGSVVPSLARETSGLDVALKTYVLTLAMSGNRYKGASYGSTTAEAFESGSDHCEMRIAGCTCTLEADNICKSSGFGGTLGGQGWYWDSNTQNLFSLWGDSSPVSEDTLFRDITSNGWSTLPLVFESGAKCTAAGASQNPLTLNTDGTVDTSCVSQLSLPAA